MSVDITETDANPVDGSQETIDSSSSQAIDTDTTAEDIWIGQRPGTWDGSGLSNIEGTYGEFRFRSAAMSSTQLAPRALNDTPTGFLVTPIKNSGAGLPKELITTTAVNGGSIDVIVYQDTDKDGTAENSETVTLSGGTDEFNSLSSSNFTESSDADYWAEFQPSVTAGTDAAPTCSRMAVKVA